MSSIFNINNAGFCTPTILAAFIGVIGTFTLAWQAMTEKDKDKRRAELIALLTKAFWTVIMIALLYWLCSKGKVEASWWIFGLVYLMTMIVMFAILFALILKR